MVQCSVFRFVFFCLSGTSEDKSLRSQTLNELQVVFEQDFLICLSSI